MNTPSHAILNLAILAEHQEPQANLFIALGAIVADLPIFFFYLWSKFVDKLPEREIWAEAYYQPFWQNIVAVFHSIPLAIAGLIITHYGGLQYIEIFFISMLLHCLLDFPVHSEDAHRHFFPLSNYRFISPISYWNPKKHGKIVSFVERLLVLLATLYVFPLVHSYIGKGLLIAVNLLYLSFYAHQAYTVAWCRLNVEKTQS